MFGKQRKAVQHELNRTTRLIARVARIRLPRLRKSHPGSAAGITTEQLATMPTQPGAAKVTVIDYSPERVETHVVENVEEESKQHRPEWVAVRWINVDGLTDLKAIQIIAEKYHLHPLAIEDVLHVPQRPKVDTYGEGPAGGGDKLPGNHPARLFVIAKMLEIIDGHLYAEQISFFVGHKTVITIQEKPGDIWDPIRQRLQKPGSQLRRNDASFLLYTLLDAIVDNCFPILEHYGDRLEELEAEVLEKPTQSVIGKVHTIRRELLLFRREVWPMREVIHTLQREPHECMNETTRTYLRDVYDHTIQIIDLCETYREFGTGLTETYMSSLSIRMNEVVKVLTIISTIFIPITFFAGVYGMNFHHMPELDKWWAYPAFWVVCIFSAGGMLIWFKRKGWL